MGTACPFSGTIPGASEIKTFQTVLCTPAFDTTPPGDRAATDGPCGRTSRESHPSEDLSELPPLLETVAGQEYHYQIVDGESLRYSLPGCFLDGWNRSHLIWPSLIAKREFTAIPCLLQVVLAHPPMSLQTFSREASRQRMYPVAGYSVFKEQ